VRDRGLGAARVPAHTFPVREYTYPSGLRVVVEEDDTTPIAGAVLVVEAGSVDDPPGKSGLAHVVEHLLFRAPSPAGPSLWKTVPRLGASSFNAMTGLEQTTYYAFVPRAALDELVAVLSERMANPARGLDEALLAQELPVVTEELQSRDERTARRRVLSAVMPASHPYARPFTEEEHPATLTISDIRTFAGRSYRPERMTLVLAGAIGAEWDQRLPALLPATLRGQETDRRPPVRRTRPASEMISASGTDDRLPMRKANVVGPELWLAWPLPPASGLEQAVPRVIGRIVERVVSESLDGSAAGMLDAHVTALTESQASTLLCRIRLRSAADADRARNEVASVVASLCTVNLRFPGPRTVAGYRHAIREATLQTVFGMESLETRAFLRAAIVHAGSGAQLSQIVSAVQKVGVDDVAAFAGRYLSKQASRAVLLVPDDPHAGAVSHGGSGPPPGSPPLDPTGGTEMDGSEDRDDDVVDGTPQQPAGLSPGAHAARVTTLANGLTVIAMRRPGLPVVSIVLGFHGEPQPGEVPGVRPALPRVPLWSMASEPIDRGILHETTIRADSYQETMRLFSEDTRKALELIAGQPEQLRVRWPSPKFERWTERAAQIEATPAARAWRTYREALFGTHPYRLTQTIDSVRTVTSTDIQRWMQSVRRPNNGALVIVGDVDPDQVSAESARLLGGWQGDAAPVPAPPPSPIVDVDRRRRPRPEILYAVDEKRRSAEIRFGCLLPAVRTLQQDLATDVLSQLIELDLHRDLRFKRGVSYAPNVRARTWRGGTAFVEGVLDVENAALPGALDRLRVWLEPDRPQPFTRADLERTRGWLARRTVFGNATNVRVASHLFYAWNMGWAPAVLDDLPGALGRMTAADVAADLAACRASGVISVVGNGPFPAAPGGSPTR
jgi:zinc protease